MLTSVCCYTVNQRFLLQALVSASQLREVTPASECDIAILCFGPIGRGEAEILQFCAKRALTLIEVPQQSLDDLPLASARLLIDALLPAHYDTIVYLDADTQVCTSLTPLLKAESDRALLFATPDPMALVNDYPRSIGASSSRHFASLGVAADLRCRYFNSGVLKFSRSNWAAISRDCIDLIRSDRFTLKYIDQDALNLVVGERYANLSLKWNFPGFLLKAEACDGIDPAVVHFMSKPRPWDGAFAPWGAEWHRPYAEAVVELPSFRAGLSSLTSLQHIRYTVQTALKRRYEQPVWTSAAFREAVRRNEASCVV